MNLHRLRDAMVGADVGALFVSDILNVQWLTGFTGSSGYALVTAGDAVFITDSRYTIQAGQEVKDFEVVWFQRPQTLEGFVAENAARVGAKKVAFETSVSYATWKSWTDKMS